MAIVLALAAALCFALSSALHQRAAQQEELHRALDPRLLLRLARSRLWLSGWLPDSAGSLLQATALRFGPLVIVQPVLSSGLFMAVLFEAALARRRILARDLAAIVAGALGLALFLAVADVRAGSTDPGPAGGVVPAPEVRRHDQHASVRGG